LDLLLASGTERHRGVVYDAVTLFAAAAERVGYEAKAVMQQQEASLLQRHSVAERTRSVAEGPSAARWPLSQRAAVAEKSWVEQTCSVDEREDKEREAAEARAKGRAMGAAGAAGGAGAWWSKERKARLLQQRKPP